MKNILIIICLFSSLLLKAQDVYLNVPAIKSDETSITVTCDVGQSISGFLCTNAYNSVTGYNFFDGKVTISLDPTILKTLTHLDFTFGVSWGTGFITKVYPIYYAPLSPGTLGANQSVYEGATPNTLNFIQPPSNLYGTRNLQWQYSTDNVNWGNASAEHADAYFMFSTSLSQTTYYRCKVSDQLNTPQYTNVVTIEVKPLPATKLAIYGESVNDSYIVCNHNPITLYNSSLPYGQAISYSMWLGSVDGINYNLSMVSGWAYTNSYSFDLNDVLRRFAPDGTPIYTYLSNYNKIYIKMSNGGDWCDPVIINIENNLNNPTISGDQSILYNSFPKDITLKTDVSNGRTPYEYSWYKIVDGVTSLVQSNNTFYSAGSLTKTSQYFVNVKTACGTTQSSNTVKINVIPVLNAGTIKSNSTNICYNSNVQIETDQTPTGGEGGYTYQWLKSIDGINFSNIPTETNETLKANNLTTTTYFQRITSSAGYTTTSNIIKITVYNELTSGTIGSPQSICYNSKPSILVNTSSPTGGDGVYQYAWQSSFDNAIWGEISGASTENYQPDILTQTTYFRRKVYGTCTAQYTPSVKIAILDNFVAGTIFTDITSLNYNTAPHAIVGSTPLGGDNNVTYQWSWSYDNSVWNNIVGGTSKDYQPGNLTQTIYYKRKDINGCNTTGLYTNPIKLIVYNDFEAGIIATSKLNFCKNTIPQQITGLAPTGGDGVFTYQWQSSIDNNNWTDILLATNLDYQPASISQTTYFRRTDLNSAKPSGLNTNTIKLSVYENIVAGNISNNNQLICYNTIPLPLLGSESTKGEGSNYHYQWYYSIDQSNWIIINNATNPNYTPNAITQKTYLRRIDSDICSNDISNVAIIDVNADFVSGEISSDNTICNNEQPSVFIGSTPSGGKGTYSYQWQKSTNQTDWSNIVNANTLNYQSINLLTTTYFRRKDVDNCSTKYTGTITTTVLPVFVSGLITSNQSIFYNTAPAKLIGYLPTGGDGNYSYQWYNSLDNSTWILIPAETDINLQPGKLTQTTYFKRLDKSGSCNSTENKEKYSNQITIEVYGAFTAGTLTGNDNICYNSQPIKITGIDPTGGDGNYNYQWQKSNDGVSWGIITGILTSEYQPGNLTQTTYFRRIDKCTTYTAYTNPVKIVVNNLVQTGTISADKYDYCYNEKPALLLGSDPAGGIGSFSYQWQKLETDGVTWTSIPNATSSSYQPNNLTSNLVLRRKETNYCSTSFSNILTLNVYSDFSNGSISSNENLCNGIQPLQIVGNQATGGSGTYSYQWQSSNDNSSWVDIASATLKDYQPAKLTQTTYYKRKDNNVCGSKYSNTIVKTVYDAFIPGTLNSISTICFNTQPPIINGTSPIGGDGTFTYQWEKSINGVNWSTMAGAVSNEYLPSSLTIPTYFRRLDNNLCGAKYTNKAFVNLFDNFIPGSIIGEQSICYNAQPNMITSVSPTGGTGTYTYQWQSSTDNTNFANISGGVNETYQPGMLTQSKYFRRIDKSGTCGSLAANTIFIEVYISILSGTISNNQTICNGLKPQKFTGSDASGGNGIYNYQWQSSSDNSQWSDIPGAIEKDYQCGNLSISTYFRRKNINSCGTSFTNSLVINVLPILQSPSLSNNQSICYNSVPSIILGSSPIGGDGTFTYQWQKSENGYGWFNVEGNSTNKDYLPNNLINKTYFRRIDSNICGTIASSTVQIDVNSNFTAGDLDGDQTICYNIAPSTITGTSPIGGDGTPTYQWQSSNTNTNDWVNVSGQVSLNYSPSKLIVSKYYRRIDNSGTCGKDTTNTVFVNVTPLFTAGTITGDQTICYNSQPTIISGTEATGGDGTINYQWQSSTDNSNWTDVASAMAKEYQPSTLSKTTYFKRSDISECGTKLTNLVTVTVYPQVLPGTISGDQTIFYNTQPNSLVGTAATGGKGNYSYQWQKSTDNINFFDIPGETGLTLNAGNLTATTYFSRNVTSGSCGLVGSNSVKITVYPLLDGGEITSDQTICYNTVPSALTGSEPTGGNGIYTYQWQSSADNIVWANIINATSNTYSPPALVSSKYYHRKVTSGAAGTSISNSIEVVVNGPLVGSIISSDQTICYNSMPQKITGTQPTGGIGTYTYQWQKSTDGSSWTNIIGANGNSYQPGILTTSIWYQRVETSGQCGTVYSNPVIITVNTILQEGTISADQTICNGSSPAKITVTSPTGATGSYTFQWEQSDNNIDWTEIPGAMINNYQPGQLTTTKYYRRVTTSGLCGTAATSPIKINVLDVVNGNTISDNQAICYNSAPSQLTGMDATGGTGTYTYQWQKSTDNSNWSNIGGATSNFYSPSSLVSNAYFRRVATSSGGCGLANSNSVQIIVNGDLHSGIIGSDQTVCYNSAPQLLTGSMPTGGTGIYTYQWQKSTDGSNWNNLLGAVNVSFQVTPLTTTTYFRRSETSGACGTVYSNTVTITVNVLFTEGTISADQTICNGGTPSRVTVSVPAGGTGAYAFQWQQSDNNYDWSDIYGATTSSYQPGVLVSNVYYRRVSASGTCGITNTGSVKINVLSSVSGGIINDDQIVCYNSIPATINGTDATGGNGTYTYQWQKSADGYAWTNISGAIANYYSPAALTIKTFYRRLSTSGTCGSSPSNQVVISLFNNLIEGTVTTDQTICFNTVPAMLIGTLPTGGDGTYTYQWQQSIDGNTWGNITNAISTSYTPPALSVSTYYRRSATSGSGCGTVYSTQIKITVNSTLTEGTVSNDQTICYNAAPTRLTVSTPTGGTGIYTYQWQQSDNNNDWSDIQGATTNTYQPNLLISTTWYRRVVTSSTCGTVFSNAIKINILPVISGGNIVDNQSICYGTTPSEITGTDATGGTGSFSYQWQKSVNEVSWTNINGYNSTSYTPSTLTSSMYYRRGATSGTCGTSYSNSVLVAVNAQLVEATIGSDQTICFNSNALPITGASATGGVGGYVYKWQKSTDGNSWSDIPGVTSSSYTPSNLKLTTYYRRSASSGTCGTVYSNSVLITVYDVLAEGTISSDQTICNGSSPTRISVSNPIGGTGVYSYQWQSSTDNFDWTNINGAATSSYLSAALTKTTFFRRASASGSCGTVYSSSMLVTVLPQVESGSVSADQTICNGAMPQTLTGTDPSGGTGIYTYQWQKSIDGASFSNVSGAKSDSYSPPALVSNSWYRRAVTSSSCGSSYSNNVLITVDAPLLEGSIGVDQTICYNSLAQSISGTNPTGGTGLYTFQWQSSTDGVQWGIINGATTNMLTPGILTNTIYYRRLATSGTCGTVYSNVVTIKVLAPIVPGIISDNQMICYNITASDLTGTDVTGGTGTYTYQWQKSSNNIIWSNISNANDVVYSPGVLAATSYYRRQVFNSACGSVYSNAVKIVVNDVLTSGEISTDQTICYNSIPEDIAGTDATGGNGSFSYQWQKSTDGYVWASISGANSLNYTSGALIKNTQFRRSVTSGACGTVYSNVVKIQVNNLLQEGTISIDQTICNGSTPQTLNGTLPSGGSGIYAYQWQSSSDGSYFSDISGANSLSYNAPNLTSTTFYRRSVKSTSCGIANSNIIKISVLPAISGGVIVTDQTICNGGTPTTLTGSSSTGGTGVYIYQWEKSSDGVSWTTINGATSTTYQAPSLTSSLYYRRMVSSGTCGNIYSNTVKITVNDMLQEGVISSDQTICFNAIPGTLTGTDPIGGTGTYIYEWQKSTDATSWVSIAPSNNSSYSPLALITTTWYRRKVTSGICGSVYSNSIKITVNGVLSEGIVSSDQTICYNSTPATLTGTTAIGGMGTYNYQWQKSDNGTTWITIDGAISSNHNPDLLSSTVWFRRTATSGSCGTVNSNVVKITVASPLVAGSISDNQTICNGALPTQLIGIDATGGTGIYNYQWQKSSNNINWANVDGAVNNLYDGPALTSTCYYRRSVKNSSCGTVYSNSVKISVNDVLVEGVIASDQTICYNSIPSPLTGTDPTGGTGTYIYEWQKSTDATSWVSIASTNNSSYSPLALTNTTWYRRKITSGICGSVYSNQIKITVNLPLSEGIITGDQTVCNGTVPVAITGTFPIGGTGVYNYQWQKSDNTTSWSTLDGAINSVYTPDILTSTAWYRRTATSGSCGTVNSNIVKITVALPLVAGSISDNQTICNGVIPAQLIGINASGGSGTYAYQWQLSTNNVNWTNVDGATNNVYDPPVLTGSTYYRRSVSSGSCGTLFSNSLKITVNLPLTSGTIYDDQTICNGTAPDQITGDDATGGTGGYNYQWQKSSDNSFWSNISGATNGYYTPPTLAVSMYYRRTVTSGSCGTVYSKPIKITVNSGLNEGTVASDQSICYNTIPGILTANDATGGTGVYNYQWQQSTDGNYFNDVVGSINKSFSGTPLTSTTWYRRKVTSGSCGTALSNLVKISVNNLLTEGSIVSDQTVCFNTVPLTLTGSLPTGGTGTYTYQWQQSINNISWGNIDGGTALSFIPPSLTSSMYYRRTVKSGSCGTVFSNSVKMTVYSAFQEGTIAYDQTICNGTAPSTITGTDPIGGTGTYSFQWQKSIDGSLWANISGAVSSILDPTALTSTTWFRRSSVSGNCGTQSSNSVKITVNEKLLGGIISSNQSICYNIVPNGLINVTLPTGGVGGYSYQWQSSIDNKNWADLQGETGFDFAPPALMATTYYRRSVISGSCGTSYSNIITIQVNGKLDGGGIKGNQSICYQTTALSLTDSISSTGGTGTYNYHWQNSSDNSNWLDVNGINTKDYSPGVLVTTNYYRRYTTSGICGTAYSNSVKVVVYDPLTAGNVGDNDTICYNSAPLKLKNYQLPTGGDGLYTFKWKESNNNVAWSDITYNADDVEYQPGTLNTRKYYKRVVASLKCGTSSTNVIVINVFNPITAGAISGIQHICYASTPDPVKSTISPTGGTGRYTYKWSVSNDNNTFNEIVGEYNDNLQPGSLTTTKYYMRSAISGSCGTANSNIISISVYPKLDAGIIVGNQNICNGSAPIGIRDSIGASGGTGSYSYQWQASTDGLQWKDINGAMSPSYIPGLLPSTTYFRRTSSNGGCGIANSNIITVNVYGALFAGEIDPDQNICYTSKPATINGSPSSGGDGTYTYQWQVSTDNITWRNLLIYGNYTSYSPDSLKVNTYYRRMVTSPRCGTALTQAMRITVFPDLTAGSIASDQTICYGARPNKLIGSTAQGAMGVYSYLWQQSTDGINFSNVIMNGDSISYTPDSLKLNQYFRRIAMAKGCGTSPSNKIKVNVSSPVNMPQVNLQTGYCLNSSFKIIETSLSDDNFKWFNVNKSIINVGKSVTIANFKYDTKYYVQTSRVDNCLSSMLELPLKVEQPKAAYNPDLTEVRIGNALRFNNQSTGAKSYVWDFFEGVKSYETSPWHYYNSEGYQSVQLTAISENNCKDSVYVKQQIKVIGKTITAVNDITDNNVVMVYPNPVKTILNVNGNGNINKLEMYSQTGQLVYYKKTEKEETITINMESLPSGIYTLRVQTTGKNTSIKIIKQ